MAESHEEIATQATSAAADRELMAVSVATQGIRQMSHYDDYRRYLEMMRQFSSIEAIEKLHSQMQVLDLLPDRFGLRPLDSISGSTFGAFSEQSELVRTFAKMTQPWSTYADTARIFADSAQSELVKSILAAQRNTQDLSNYYSKALESTLRQAETIIGLQQNEAMREWERLSNSLLRPEWKEILDELAATELSAAEIVERAGELAEERELQFEFPEQGRQEDRLSKISFLLAVLGIVLALWQIYRAEVLAADSDSKADAIETRLKEGFAAQSALLAELQRELRRAEDSRWRVAELTAQLRLSPVAGSKKLRELKPGEICVELGQEGKWLLVELVVDGHRISGWVLKKRLERITPANKAQ